MTAAPGTGVTVGFLDSGLDLNHPALDPTKLSLTYHLDAEDEIPTPGVSHGTGVASVVGAHPERSRRAFPGTPLRGVAWGADLKMLVIGGLRTPGPDPTYDPITLGDLREEAPGIGRTVGRLIHEQSADIVSVSIGYDGLVEDYTEEQIRANFNTVIEVLKQPQAQPGDESILVLAAGNGNGERCNLDRRFPDRCVNGRLAATSPDILPGMMAWIPELRGHSIAVVATRMGGRIMDMSNRCGIAAEWCIAAPGEDVYVASTESGSPGVYKASGTSLAAPMVAGGLAVMKQLFRSQLSNTGLVSRLFMTADKGAPYDDAETYGQGFMDLDAATRPVGRVSVATAQTVDGPGVALGTTAVRPGAAFGDGIARSLEGREIAAFDELGAPFWFALDGLSGHRAAAPSGLGRLLAPSIGGGRGGSLLALAPVDGTVMEGRDGAQLRFGMARPASTGHASLAGDATTLSFANGAGIEAAAFTTSGTADRAAVSGAAISWRSASSPTGLRAGWIGERETLLGTGASGAFGGISGDSMFAGLTAGPYPAGGWSLLADAEIGMAAPRGRGGLLESVSSLTTSAFAFSGRRTLADGDEVTLRVYQPLRLEDGEGRFTVPVGRTPGGRVLRSSFTADLSPSGRQVGISAEWRRPLTETARLSAGVTWTRHPGHDSRSAPEMRLLAGFAVDL